MVDRLAIILPAVYHKSQVQCAMLHKYETKSLLGHKSRCFDARFSNDGSTLLTASEDGTAILWSVDKQKAVCTLKHNKESEVLRATFLDKSSLLVVTCGADGRAIVWKGDELSPNSTEEVSTCRSSSSSSRSSSTSSIARFTKLSTLKHDESAQIYACESLSSANDESSSMTMVTAADSLLCLWDPAALSTEPTYTWTITEKVGLESGFVPFGGPRNPGNQAFIFDAKKHPCDRNLVALAVSDSSVRQVDLRTRHVAGAMSISPSCRSDSTPATHSRPQLTPAKRQFSTVEGDSVVDEGLTSPGNEGNDAHPGLFLSLAELSPCLRSFKTADQTQKIQPSPPVAKVHVTSVRRTTQLRYLCCEFLVHPHLQNKQCIHIACNLLCHVMSTSSHPHHI